MIETVAMRKLLIVGMISLLAGCALIDGNSERQDEVRDGNVTVAADGRALTVRNGTEAPIYTFEVGATIAPLILWAPTVNAEDAIAPGAERVMPYDNLLIDDAEVEVLVYWWHATTRDGERVPDEIQVLTVSL